MADLIKLLPDSVANQIAAGEVVQRPASVVKELVENAVDAGATSITVNIQEGGRGLIQVIDNGCGISPDDSKMAFERHATSKITKADDLYALSTFGFRGEALASIASVSEVELRTKRETDDVGLRLYVNGGVFGESTAVNIQTGTQLLVKNLFYNVPARRKFLKSKSVETKHIVDEFQRVALCNPQIEMSLYDNDTPRYRLASTTRRQRIVGMFGKHINSNLLDLNVETSIIRIEGFVGTPQSAKKSGTAEQFLFVNNRFFRSNYYHKAVMAAYEKLIQPGVYPPYFLYMTVDPARIDINIHPTKTEIKFEDEQAIWQILNASVRESLGKMGAVPLMDFEAEDRIDIPVFRPGSQDEIKIPPVSLNPTFNPFDADDDLPGPQASPGGPSVSGPGRVSGSTPKSAGGFLQNMTYGEDGMPEGWEELSKDGYDTFDPSTTNGDTFRNFILDDQPAEDAELDEFISKGFEQDVTGDESWTEQGALEIESKLAAGFYFLRISNRYIAVSQDNGLTIIDLKRAHHRVLYESFLRKEASEMTVNQQELFPEPIPVSPEDLRLLTEVQKGLLAIGFDIRPEGKNSVVIKGIPADMDSVPNRELIDSLLAQLHEHGIPDAKNRKKSLALTMAGACCMKKARYLQKEEIEELILSLYACKEPAFTADGRQVLTTLEADEIKKRLQ